MMVVAPVFRQTKSAMTVGICEHGGLKPQNSLLEQKCSLGVMLEVGALVPV
jgi:hypothetical protein